MPATVCCFRQRQPDSRYFAVVTTAVTCLVMLLCAPGCARHGVVDDSTTISHGWSFDGILKNGIRIPSRGDGYWVPRRWDRRDNQYGTEELVTMIVRVARRIQARSPGPLLGVADLSPPGGGPSPWHRSHQTGRDVDLLFFNVDRKGRPVRSKAMIPFDENGRSREPVGKYKERLYFDLDRNWLLIKELLMEPTVDIQYLYIYTPLEHLLLDHARSIGESRTLIARADALMEQPENSGLHDDHLHVRLYCPQSDRAFGCLDAWDPPWHREADLHAWSMAMLGNPVFQAVTQLVISGT